MESIDAKTDEKHLPSYEASERYCIGFVVYCSDNFFNQSYFDDLMLRNTFLCFKFVLGRLPHFN